jgi:hypothetical protein
VVTPSSAPPSARLRRSPARRARRRARGGDEGAFYAYAYPEPDGFAEYPVAPAEAFYSRENGQFLLPYEAVRGARDPDRALGEFLHTTYEAAAERGGWDRAALEDDPNRWEHQQR